MPITKPLESEYVAHYHTYISKVSGNDLVQVLNAGCENVIAFLQSIPSDKYGYRYAEGKWTIREVIAHIIDGERVFAYRALVFARNDKNALPGFDENEYAPQSNAETRSKESLIDEYMHLRKANIRLFESFTDEMALRKGIASGNEISVRALGYTIAGHEIHHMGVIKERYL
jgi:uncharacterized damage-inducible protein DinB